MMKDYLKANASIWAARRIFTCFVLAIGGYSCATSRARLGLDEMPTYERGFQIFPSPRTFDAPGTVFRVDPSGVRRPVADLSGMLLIIPRDEAVPKLTITGNLNIDLFLRWLGSSRAWGQLQTQDSASVSVSGARREQAFEVDLQRVVDSAAKLIDWGKQGRVYVITETVLADSVEFSLGRSTRAAIGDTLKSDSAAANSIAVRWTPQSSTAHLALRFKQPHRIFYKVEQLVRRRPLEADTVPIIARIRVVASITWSDGGMP